jgi:beta-phosphoglucomutase-like phosphatase (HAD superfamily)
MLLDLPHKRAWHETLQLLIWSDRHDIRPRTIYTPERFTPAVCQETVAGKPRMSGARAALEVSPQDCCFVVEDATSGVQTAESGNMAALDVPRLDDEELLRRAGADLGVTTLEDVDLDALAEVRLEQRSR